MTVGSISLVGGRNHWEVSSFLWLVVDTGCQLELQLGLSAEPSTGDKQWLAQIPWLGTESLWLRVTMAQIPWEGTETHCSQWERCQRICRHIVKPSQYLLDSAITVK